MKIQLRRQLSVAIENQPGRLAHICRILAQHAVHIDAFCVLDNVEQGMVRLLTSDANQTRGLLKAEGLPVVEAEVVAIELTDCVGSLAEVGEALGRANINIEYAYASTTAIGEPASVILRTARPKEACEVLAAMGHAG
jgi:hypothetical protein